MFFGWSLGWVLFWVRTSSTFSVLRPFSYLRPFLYFDRSTSTRLLRPFVKSGLPYWSRSTGRSTVLVEVQFWSKYIIGRTDAYPVCLRNILEEKCPGSSANCYVIVRGCAFIYFLTQMVTFLFPYFFSIDLIYR